jgi:N-acetylglucosamine kinase-like BadF-type ATPase
MTKKTSTKRLPVRLLAVDGGNSKTDLVLIGHRGEALASAHGPGSSHVLSGIDAGVGVIAAMLEEALSAVSGSTLVSKAEPSIGEAVADLGIYCLAGADLPYDDRRLTTAFAERGWCRRTEVRNDAFAVLRAGTERGWGVAIVCGAGINCIGVGPDGRVLRFPALGEISGDWGGGYDVGMAALGAAMRGRDGRDMHTSLERDVPRHFGFSQPMALVSAFYKGRIDQNRVTELAPVVFEASANGDAVAMSILDRLADEIVALAKAALSRLRFKSDQVEVVLGGGMFKQEHSRLVSRIGERLEAEAPRATMVLLKESPLSGAAMLGLEMLGASKPEIVRVRAALNNGHSPRATS